MKVGFLKSIAAMLVGTGFAMAQSSGPAPAKVPPSDINYPAAAGQQAPTPLATNHDAEHFGGIDWSDGPVQPYRVYSGADYLMWNIRNPNLPQLATAVPVGLVLVNQTDLFVGPDGTGPVTSTYSIPFSVSNNPSFPNGQSIDMGEHNGARVTLGMWFDSEMDLGVELSGFWLEKREEQFHNTTANTVNQFNISTGLADRTFFVPAGGSPQLISSAITVFPSQSNSNVNATFATEMWGAELNMRCSGYRFGMLTFGGLAGARFIHFEDTLTLTNDVRVTDAPQSPSQAPFLPIIFSTFDRIRTENAIIAPQIGAEVEGECYGFFMNARAKVAIGPNFQEVHATGNTTVVGSANPLTRSPGGLLTGPLSLGEQHKTHIATVPELNLKAGYQFNSSGRIFVGYDALYMQHVTRPGQTVGQTALATAVTVNGSTNTVNVMQPTINIRDLDIWIQGINFGVEFRY